MTNFLAKLFVKDYNQPEKPEVRERYGTFASIVGVITNVVLATMKLLVGVIAGSIAIIADSLNNYSDAGSSIVSFVSFKIAAKPADRDHPFGHARIEYICSMIVSFLILLVGVELFSESITSLFGEQKETEAISIFTCIVLGASILFKLWLALFYKSVAKTINSSVIAASATDSIFDAISTAAVFAANIVVTLTGLWFIDAIVGMIVAVMIVLAGIRILNETKNSILGEAPTEDLIKDLKSIVARYPEILDVHDMIVHNYGPNTFIASFHAEVDGKADVYMLHDTIDVVEREINRELGILCTIHMDPIVTDDEVVSALRKLSADVVSSLYSGASIHDFRTVVGHTHTNLIFDVALPFEITDKDDIVIAKISEKVSEYNPNYYAVITIDRQ